jgi:hypothetical protein
MENLTSYFIGALSGVALMATNELVWGGGRSDQRSNKIFKLRRIEICYGAQS